MNPESYVIYDNANNLINEVDSSLIAKEKLMAEKVHEILIRPPLPL
jgi:hypothetical protein